MWIQGSHNIQFTLLWFSRIEFVKDSKSLAKGSILDGSYDVMRRNKENIFANNMG